MGFSHGAYFTAREGFPDPAFQVRQVRAGISIPATTKPKLSGNYFSKQDISFKFM
jgi:hypothetical protein